MWLMVLLLLSVTAIILMTARLHLHPFLALIAAAFGYGVLSGRLSLAEVVEAVNQGFAGTVGSIGIVILAGGIIGTFLEKSGGAQSLAAAAIRVTGRRRVPLAMALIGSAVSVPVFCDSGFVILAPLAITLSLSAGVSLATTALSLSLGLLATHSMVPPTPGPLAASQILGADLGQVVLFGLLVSAPALAGGLIFAARVGKGLTLGPERTPPRESAQPVGLLPSAARSVVPILLPIVLIVLGSANQMWQPFGESILGEAVQFAGQPVVALLVGMLFAFTLPPRLTTEMLSPRGWVGQAIGSVTTIIVVTAAGGAFGRVLQASMIGELVGQQLAQAQLGIWLPILLAAGLKTAQGSGTVAIITAAGIMAPLLSSFGLDSPTGRALVTVAIGAGGMMVSHANDSYFWVVTQLSGMTVRQGYRLQTLGTLLQGLVAACTVWLLSLLVL